MLDNKKKSFEKKKNLICHFNTAQRPIRHIDVRHDLFVTISFHRILKQKLSQAKLNGFDI